jgi:hypothetical protein
MGLAALLAVVGLVLTAGPGAAQKKKTKEPIIYNVTAKDISEEFLKAKARAERRYNPPAALAPAFVDMDGYVATVDDEGKTVTLESNPKAVVTLKAKKITGEKEGKRVAIAKKGKYVEFNAKDKKLVFEFEEVMLKKLPE